jgi:hypothetical protein
MGGGISSYDPEIPFCGEFRKTDIQRREEGKLITDRNMYNNIGSSPPCLHKLDRSLGWSVLLAKTSLNTYIAGEPSKASSSDAAFSEISRNRRIKKSVQQERVKR